MKKIFSILLTLMISVSFAQVDRSKQPEPGPSPTPDFGKYKLYELKNGLKLIVVQNDKLPRVTMNLVIDRDPIFEGGKAGYVSLAGEMLRQGTNNLEKAALDEKVDFMGANIGTSSSNVFTSGLSKYSEELMALLADVAMNPAFPESEFEKLKTQTISGLESNKDNPEAVAGQVFYSVLFGKEHPYGESPTVATVESVSLDDCKKYYKKYWLPNNAYIAIVGNIKPRAAKKLAKKYFGSWEMGTKTTNSFKAPASHKKMEVAFVHKESAVQSVINLGNTIDLKPGHPDIIKLRLANQILGVGSLGRLFQNIREDKAYTYGAYSEYDSDKLAGSFSASASVRNEVTDSAIVEFLKEFDRIRNEPVTDEEIKGAKQFIKGSFGRSLESPQTVASFALNIQRYGLDEDYYKNYLNELDKVTKEDIMAMAKKYILPENMVLTIVGKASDVSASLEKFGEIKYYDEEGNITEKPSIPVPAGVSAQMVLDNYITALGGKENIDKLKDVAIDFEVTIPGAPQKFTGARLKKGNTKYKFVMAMGEMVLQEQIYDGRKGFLSSPQGSSVQEGDDAKDLRNSALFVSEMEYSNSEIYTLSLSRMAMVEGEKAFVMTVTKKDEDPISVYFSEKTGLKIKTEQVEDSPQGPVSTIVLFSDYKEYNEVKFPMTETLVLGPQKIVLTAVDIKVNKGISNAEFIIK